MDSSNTSTVTLSDSISGYVTANEEDTSDIAENTQYLSVLSQDLSFDSMNLTLSNDQNENEETQLVEVASEQGESLIFTVEGSDEFYGIQLSQDQEGNFQKYKIKYAENINGQLVPMLETIQILSLNDELQPDEVEYDTVTEDTHVNIASDVGQLDEAEYDTVTEGTHVNIVSDISESIINQSQSNCFNEENEDLASVDNMQSIPALPSNNTHSPSITVKQEILNLIDDGVNVETQSSVNYWMDDNDDEEEQQYDLDSNSTMQNIPEELVEVEMDEIDLNEDMNDHNSEDEDTINQLQVDSVEQIGQLFIEDNFILEESEVLENNAIVPNNPNGNMYEIITDEQVDSNIEIYTSETVLKESADHQTKTNILKKPMQKSILKNHNAPDSKTTYPISLGEKENLEVLEIERPQKPNSRSLLRCNQPSRVLPDPLKPVVEKKYEGRYYRTKEAKQARQFMNFINSTTIPQVPERKERLPRKQKIKPVKHLNEDIVVKEMIVSSGGFIEPDIVEEKKSLPVTEYVELIDSGDESDNRKKDVNKKLIEIEISDSEESNTSTQSIQTKNTCMKKKRGRPPKNKNESNKTDTDSNSESPPKISRTDSDGDSSPNIAQTNKIDSLKSNLKIMKPKEKNGNQHCSTTEKSYNSESTNIENKIQSMKKDNFQSKLSKTEKKPDELLSVTSSKKSARTTQSRPQKEFDYRYECDKCKSKFINKILLGRHNCVTKSGLPFSCDACPKKFPNAVSLTIHKKMHSRDVKITQENKLNIETNIKAVPKLGVPPVPNSKMVNTKLPVKGQIKLTLPQKTKGNTSLAITKNLNSGRINQKNLLKPNTGTESKTPERSLRVKDFKFAKQCDKCPMRFDNNAAWFDHQVLCHGLKTPDKNIGKNKPTKLVKPSETHKGIPLGTTASKNFLKISAMIKQQQH